jgi:TonB family protein
MTWWQYLGLVNIYLLLFYGFYAILLSRETFFQLNRIYLVSAALLSFFIPVIQSDWVKNLFITQKVQYTIYSSPVMLYHFKPIQDTHFTVGQFLVIVYLAGMAFLMARLTLQLFALSKIVGNAHSPVAYSFFKKIKLGDDSQNHPVIAEHEKAHARQWHSADVLIMEALTIINWFNPVVYLYRFAIKHIHEFIADRQAIKSGTAKIDYALLLLSQTFNAPAHQLVNPFFNKSLLKQRIIMIQKSKSHRVAIIKYFLSAPLFILMLILSSASVNNSNTIRLIDKKAELVFLKPALATLTTKSIPDLPVEKVVLKELNKTPAGDKHLGQAEMQAIKDTTPKADDKVFITVDQVPEFPGGVSAFITFLSKNVRYPKEARENNVQGKIIVSFVVEKDGTLSSILVRRGIGSGCDEEAVRVLGLSPRWKPGSQKGRPVRVAYTVPINFTLEGTGNPPPVQKTGSVNEGKGNGNSMAVTDGNTLPALDTAKKITAFNMHEYFNGLTPLYLVDGRQTDDLTSINPRDIESVSVLKGKSVALYGPKGANGVVVITTKRNLLKDKLMLFDKKKTATLMSN